MTVPFENSMTSPRKPTAGFWITVALVAVLVGYPLSVGPACWISYWTGFGGKAIAIAYGPIGSLLAGDSTAADTVQWYAQLGVPANVKFQWSSDVSPVWRGRVERIGDFDFDFDF
jgi:hypothetical protein